MPATRCRVGSPRCTTTAVQRLGHPFAVRPASDILDLGSLPRPVDLPELSEAPDLALAVAARTHEGGEVGRRRHRPSGSRRARQRGRDPTLAAPLSPRRAAAGARRWGRRRRGTSHHVERHAEQALVLAHCAIVGSRANPASRSASWSLASRTTSWADGGSGGRGGRRRRSVLAALEQEREVRAAAFADPLRVVSPEPRPCSSRNAATRSRTSSGGFASPSRRPLSRRCPPPDREHAAPCDPMRPMRRRLYLMRHAEVSYFGHDGTPVDPVDVSLNEEGVDQATLRRRRWRASSSIAC